MSQSSSSLVSIGYIISIMPLLLLPIIFLPMGIIVAIINISNDKAIHGLIQLVLTVSLGIAGAMMGGWGFGLPKLHF